MKNMVLIGKKNRDEYDEIYNQGNDEEFLKKLREDIINLDCPKCGGISSMIHDADNRCFVCTKCGFAEAEDFFYREVGGLTNDIDLEGRDWGEEYEDVYTEDGDIVNCGVCGAELKWRLYEYDKTVCPNCEDIMSRAALFNYIGADPPGKECYTCSELYPGCSKCPYGYDGGYKD